MTTRLLSPRGAADRLPGVEPYELAAWRKHGWFPAPDAVIGARPAHPGWDPERIDRFERENMTQARRCFAEKGGRHRRSTGAPPWWRVEAVRYLSIPDIASTAALTESSLWAHYRKSGLPEPDIIIAARTIKRPGWSPERARAAAAELGWQWNLARLADTRGLEPHL